MLLITEQSFDWVKPIIEEGTEGRPKSYFIEGIMLQAETVNRNGRKYPTKILMKECERYSKDLIREKRSFGELNHPSSPTVNLDRVSHMITELRQSGNDVIGRAKILSTPMGNIAKSLIEEGARLGVSSRGMGSLKKINEVNEVQPDFMLSAIDIVADPSAPGAFVNGILEGKQWVWDNGLLREEEISKMHREIKNTSSKQLQETTLKLFKKFIRGL
jgi:hypothetical protein